jgi:methane/ammonia monooxygenase subunit C
MNTTVIKTGAAGAHHPQATPAHGLSGSFINAKWLTIGVVGFVVIIGFWRWYQQAFAWSMGMDSTAPEFDTYWMTLFKVNLAVVVTSWAVLWPWLWFTRDKHLDQLKPREEVKRYFTFVSILIMYALFVYAGGSFFGEQDASWHQTVVRDTSFTPSHIPLFYGAMPLFVTFGVGAWIYAATRLPRFSKRISIPLTLAVVGPFLILPSLGLNEWGHAFWMMEEFFAHPLHWGFVILSWSLLALGGLLAQVVPHMIDLFKRIEAEQA